MVHARTCSGRCVLLTQTMKALKTQGHQAQPKKTQGEKDKKKTLYEVQNKRKGIHPGIFEAGKK